MSPQPPHDPLCEWSSLAPPLTPCKQCDVIDRVRDDERERITSELSSKVAEGLLKGWSPAAVRAFEIAHQIARGSQARS